MWTVARALGAGLLLVGVGSRAPLHAAPGDPVGAEFQVNAYTTGRQVNPVVAPHGAGFVVVWRSEGSPGTDTSSFSVQGQRFDSTGLPDGAQFQVNTYTTGFQAGPAAAPLADGGFVVVWSSEEGDGTDPEGSVQAQRFDAAGLPVGGQFQVNGSTASTQDSGVVAAAGAGGFVVIWRSEDGTEDDSDFNIHGQRYDAAGAPAGEEFQVNTYTTDLQRKPLVLGLDGGSFVVAWQSYGSLGSDDDAGSIQARLFDAAGAAANPEFQVNTYTTSFQFFPGIGPDGSGGFVVTWESGGSAGTDDDESSAQARRFDATGAPRGDDFQVNTYTTGAQFGYSVSPDGVGGFVVVWGSYAGIEDDDSLRSIQARRFDAAGAPVGPDFQVNTFTTGDQELPSVARDGAGGFVVAWQCDGGDGTDRSDVSIHAQRFAGPTPPTTTTTTTSGAPTTTTTTATVPGGLTGQALEGRKLQLTVRPDRPERSKLFMLSKDPGLGLGRGNGSADDPVVHGGELRVSSSAGGFGVAHALAGGWRYVGRSGQGKGYKWKSRTAPIRSILVRAGSKIVIVGRGAGLGLDLDDDPSLVRVELRIGAHTYCLEFGSESPKFKASRLYRARRAAAPAVCP